MESDTFYRLFVAVEIPAAATRQLIGWQRRYLAGERALRLTPEGQLHVTLVFLGKMGEEGRDLAVSEVRGLEGERAFDAALTGLVGLPRRRQPRVIAAAVEEPAGVLAQIQSKLALALVKKKLYKQEKRPYFPHVTVARSRGRVRLDVGEIHPDPVQFTAVRITLYNSILKPEGALHEPLETVRLT
jgi:2'-5' RNA ligase